ncbi:MAG TPA: ABC transporter ATP-binding protein, partial [Thermomicrobiales bacterium]|nr:ABC transporter ATP-binding protein [Thermomicrobiales bacterium]
LTMTASNQRPAIVARRLTKRYGSVAALTDLDFTIAEGEAVALWGANGAGKTTLLRCVLGLARSTGELDIFGVDPRRDGRAARELIGYVPQDLPVSPMTVGEQIVFITRLKRASLESAREQLAQLGLGGEEGKRIDALSGGMRQRLSLVLALIGSPRVLLFDEPTANLDARGRAELLTLLQRLKQEGRTVLFSSHRPEDVLTLADRVLMLEGGHLREAKTPRQFEQDLGNAHLVITLRNGHLQQALSTLSSLGYDGAGEGHVLTVPVRLREKADVISVLAREGIDIADFDVEQVGWTK